MRNHLFNKLILYISFIIMIIVFVYLLAKPLIVYLGLCSSLSSYCKYLTSIFFNSFIYLLLGAGVSYAFFRHLFGSLKKVKYLKNFSEYKNNDTKLNNVIKSCPNSIGKKIKIYISNDVKPIAFSAGIFNKALYLSKGTLSNLNEPKLSAIIQHEIAHIIHKDVLHLTIARFVCDIFFYLPGLKIIFYNKLKAEKEYMADNYAASKSGDDNFVIDALLKISHLRLTENYPLIAFTDNKTDVIKRIIKLQGKEVKNTINKSAIIITITTILMLSIFTINAGAAVANHGCIMHKQVKVNHCVK